MMRASPHEEITMDQHPETEAERDVDDQDVEAHSMLVEAQGREMQARREREARDLSASHHARSTKASRPSRLRRLLGG
jgi:hypothetical protein